MKGVEIQLMSKKLDKACSKGFTLIELSFVVFILALVAALATIRYGSKMQEVKIRAAETDLLSLRLALVGNEISPGYLGDMSSIPGFTPAFLRIHNLLNRTNIVAKVVDSAGFHFVFLDRYASSASPENVASFNTYTNWSAEAGRGWNGPYIKSGAKTMNTVPERLGLFPAADDRRTATDSTFHDRGFYPDDVPTEVSDYVEGFGVSGEQALGDPWGNPYVLQIPPPAAFVTSDNVSDQKRFEYARLVSAGPNGILETPCYTVPSSVSDATKRRAFLRLAGRLANGDVTARGDDLVLFVNREDQYGENE